MMLGNKQTMPPIKAKTKFVQASLLEEVSLQSSQRAPQNVSGIHH
jgi:hypothetical protein